MIYNIYMRMIIGFIIVIVLLHAFGCSQTETSLDPKKNYKMELYFEHGKQFGTGMIALPKQKEYDITMIAEDKINYLSFRSCSREVVVENPKSWMNRKKFIYHYVPNQLESDGACPAMITAINKTGMANLGFIDFADDVSVLPAKNICGEITENTIGVNVCQERIDGLEKIIFPVEVQASPDPGCTFETPLKGTEFIYKIKKGYCVFTFIETKPPGRLARLITFGYDDIQMKL